MTLPETLPDEGRDRAAPRIETAREERPSMSFQIARLNVIHLVGALVALLIATIALAQAHDYTLDGLRIGHPWARASAGAAPTGAAYFALENRGGEPDRLVSASTPAAERAELHTHLHENGVMKMRPVEGGIELPAGGQVLLAPGGLHVMLMGLKAPLKEGERFPLTLTFEKAGELQVEVAVEPIGYQPPQDMGGMHRDGTGHGSGQGAGHEKQ